MKENRKKAPSLGHPQSHHEEVHTLEERQLRELSEARSASWSCGDWKVEYFKREGPGKSKWELVVQVESQGFG